MPCPPLLSSLGPLRAIYQVPPKDTPIQWDECEDIRVTDDEGAVLYNGPRYLRCKRAECRCVVTHGMVIEGGCWCGNRRLEACATLTAAERGLLKRGYYPLVAWEQEAIHPQVLAGKTLGWGKDDWKARHA